MCLNYPLQGNTGAFVDGIILYVKKLDNNQPIMLTAVEAAKITTSAPFLCGIQG